MTGEIRTRKGGWQSTVGKISGGQTRQGHHWKLYARVKDAASWTGGRIDGQRREGWRNGGGGGGDSKSRGLVPHIPGIWSRAGTRGCCVQGICIRRLGPSPPAAF